MKVDFILCGQGIAGSMLAWFLLKAEKKVMILDYFQPNSASQIATGIINPVTGKRLVKSWRIDELLPFARNTYRELEIALGARFFSEKAICRIFSNREDFRFFSQKNELGELPEDIVPLGNLPESFIPPALGGVKIAGVYQLDYPVILKALRKFYKQQNLIREQRVRYNQIQIGPEGVSYEDIESSKLIFCEGCNASENPYFRWLPFNLAKGEILVVRMNAFPEDNIWHKGIFIIPLGNQLFRIGSTYEWNSTDDLPSQQGREKLIAKLKRAINVPFEVIEHHAAIRPTVMDRRPFIGIHPQFSALGIFNGLGTKGASLAPYFAWRFAKFLTEDIPLEEEVNISRFSGEPFFPKGSL